MARTIGEELIAYLIYEPKLVGKAVEVLQPQHFIRENERIVFESLRDLYDHGLEIGIFNVAKECEKSGYRYEWVPYILEFATEVRVVNVENYARLIRTEWRRHKLETMAFKVRSSLESESPPEEILDEVEKEIAVISAEDENKQSDGAIGNALVKMSDLIESNRGKRGLIGLPTGFPTLDKYTHGFQAKTVTIVAGRPSMGKTCFALNVMVNMAKRGKKVVFFSIEMPEEAVAFRITSMVSGISMSDLMSGDLDKTLVDQYSNAVSQLGAMPIRIYDYFYTASAIIRMIRKIHRTEGLDAVFIDYLQHFKLPNKRDKREEVGEISRLFKELAKELNIAIVLVSQLNRGSDARTDKRPMLSDLKDSGDIEQDADVVLMLYNEFYYDPSASETLSDVTIAKNRQGQTGRIDLAWQRHIQKFSEADFFTGVQECITS